jgi:phosphatidylglycerophosphate synthase
VLPKRHIPNSLTIARLALAGVFFLMLARWSSSDPRPDPARPDLPLLIAAAVFTLAAFTDALDGYLARRWKVVSVFGRIMDPFADKILVLGAFVMLAGPNFAHTVLLGIDAHRLDDYTFVHVSKVDPLARQLSHVAPWMAVVILARELLVTSLRAAFESRGVDFSAGPSGKAKMILQSGCVPFVLVAVAFRAVPPTDPAPLEIAAKWLVWVTVVVTAWSALPYIARARALARAVPPVPSTPAPPPTDILPTL